MAVSKREELGQIVIRPPAGMRERIKAAADANNRSMNAEIVAALEERYPAPREPIGDFRGVYDLMDFVMSGETDEERETFLKLANRQIEESELSGWLQLGLGDDPNQPGTPVVFMRTLNDGKAPKAGIKRSKF